LLEKNIETLAFARILPKLNDWVKR